jgi:hypothetical protein
MADNHANHCHLWHIERWIIICFRSQVLRLLSQ